jgi:stearoyl-CoA desaturase (delta-9 desaturase)
MASAPQAVPVHSIRDTYFRPWSLPFWAIHVLAVWFAIVTGWSWTGLAVAVASYYVRMFFVTAAYHRYFSHRTFKTSRPVQLLMALGAQTSAQKGVLWWAANHRHHHKYSDAPEDVHSAKQRGFWYSHIGWLLGPDYNSTDLSKIPDMAKYPELRFLNHPLVQLLPAVAMGAVCYFVGNFWWLTWGFFVPTVLLWHGTFTINSLSHMFGKRRYQTTDDSRNNWLLALLTLGEGWHNNHHHYQSATPNGFFWWEIDITWYVLRLLGALGIVWDLRRPPKELLAPAESPAPTVKEAG